MSPNSTQTTMGPSSTRMFFFRGERTAQRDSPLVDVDVNGSHRQFPLTGSGAVASADTPPRRERVDGVGDLSGEAIASSLPLRRIEQIDDSSPHRRSTDEAQSLHDWSMAGARRRLAWHIAWSQPQKPPDIVPTSQDSLQNPPSSMTRQVHDSCAHSIEFLRLSGANAFPPRAALKTGMGPHGFQTELASRSGNPAGSIVASGVIVTKFLAQSAVSVAGSVPADDDPTTN